MSFSSTHAASIFLGEAFPENKVLTHPHMLTYSLFQIQNLLKASMWYTNLNLKETKTNKKQTNKNKQTKNKNKTKKKKKKTICTISSSTKESSMYYSFA